MNNVCLNHSKNIKAYKYLKIHILGKKGYIKESWN